MENNQQQKRVFVVWAKGESLVSHFLAQAIGAEMLISFKTREDGSTPNAFCRYAWQARDTYQRLKGLKPEMIWVQNPPIFAVLTVCIFTRFNGGRFIIDTHTAGFLDGKWRFFFFLHKMLSRRALFNTVHNFKNLEILENWRINNSKVLQFYNPRREEILDETVSLDKHLDEQSRKYPFKVFMVNRFAYDDAYEEVIKTARLMPEAAFFITGNDKNFLNKEVLPENVILTGFLEHKEFIVLMDRCDVVLALTKRKDTVLWSIREALALRKPFVATDSEAIRHYFQDIGIFSDHSSVHMKKAILLAMAEKENIRGRMAKFLETDRERWKRDIDMLDQIMKGGSKSPQKGN